MSSRYVSGRTDLLLVFMLFSLTLFFIRLCDVAHVYFSGVLFTLSTIMSASFSSLLCIPCILLPACLCCVPLFLCNYNSLPDRVFLCRYRFYTGVYLHLDLSFLCCSRLSFVFPAFFRTFFSTLLLSPPTAAVRLCRRESILTGYL